VIVFCDIETTGLEPSECDVLEVASIITDDALNELARFQRVIYSPFAARIVELADVGNNALDIHNLLTGFHRPNLIPIDMHLKNGLWKECVYGQALDTVDRDFAAFIKQYGIREYYEPAAPGPDGAMGAPQLKWERPILGGSTISFDRSFLKVHLPRAFGMLHYRNCDVSSFKETAKRFWPTIALPRTAPESVAHRGMKDIEASIAEYRHYLERLQVLPEGARWLSIPYTKDTHVELPNEGMS